MQPRRKRRMRCTYCGSLATKRNGKRKLTPVSFERRIKRCECTALRKFAVRQLTTWDKYFTFFTCLLRLRRIQQARLVLQLSHGADGDGLLNHQKDNLIPKTNNLAEDKNRPIKRRFTPLDDLNKWMSK